MSVTIYPQPDKTETIRVEGRVSKEYINHLLRKKERHIPLSNSEQELLSLLPD